MSFLDTPAKNIPGLQSVVAAVLGLCYSSALAIYTGQPLVVAAFAAIISYLVALPVLWLMRRRGAEYGSMTIASFFWIPAPSVLLVQVGWWFYHAYFNFPSA